MSWATKRRLFIVFVVLALISVFVFLVYSPDFFETPTCTDLKQNGEETGIDCGGTCPNLCIAQTKDPVVLWTRSFEVTDSIYTAVAYIENQNAGAVERLPYEFRLYDAKGVYITRVQGTALVPPLGRYAIVEPGINTGSADVTRTTIVFGQNYGPWKRISDEVRSIRIATSAIELDREGIIPRLSGRLTNQSPVATLSNTSVVAILYGSSGNALAVSKTLVPLLRPNESTTVYFTWPKNFEEEVTRFELIPIIDVFALSV